MPRVTITNTLFFFHFCSMLLIARRRRAPPQPLSSLFSPPQLAAGPAGLPCLPVFLFRRSSALSVRRTVVFQLWFRSHHSHCPTADSAAVGGGCGRPPAMDVPHAADLFTPWRLLLAIAAASLIHSPLPPASPPPPPPPTPPSRPTSLPASHPSSTPPPPTHPTTSCCLPRRACTRASPTP